MHSRLISVIVGVAWGVMAASASAATEKSDVTSSLRMAARYVQRHQYQQAMGEFQNALKADPESAAANAGMGNLYAGMKQCEKAIPYLEKALRIDPHDDTALFGLGACYMDLQQHEKAIPYLQQALKIHPDNRGAARALAHAYVRRGVIAGRAGQHRQARAPLRAALTLFQQLGDQQGVDDMTRALSEIPK